MAGLLDDDEPLSWREALRRYPRLADAGAEVVVSPLDQGRGRILETWPPGEEGAPGQPRPDALPLDQVGVELFGGDVRPVDVLGDLTGHHLRFTDPVVANYYAQFDRSMTPEQEQRLRAQYDWYTQNAGEQRPYEQWRHISGMPAYVGGYAWQQWPADSYESWYTPEQRATLDHLLRYLAGGMQR